MNTLKPIFILSFGIKAIVVIFSMLPLVTRFYPFLLLSKKTLMQLSNNLIELRNFKKYHFLLIITYFLFISPQKILFEGAPPVIG